MFSYIPAWYHFNPVRIYFGKGVRARLVETFNSVRILVVTTPRGRRQFEQDPIFGTLFSSNDILWMDGVETNPGLLGLQAAIDRLKCESFDAVIGFGGGSAIDTAKALAVALSPVLTGTPLATLLADPILHKSVRPKPLYALPTTSGTGSEVTPFSTVWDHEQRKKYSLAGPAVFPHTAIVDPDLTHGLPQSVTLSTGLDAINQAAEAFWNRNMTPISEGFSLRALQLGFGALPRLMVNLDDREAREQMAECSLLAGLAISQTRTALCHSMSYPITAHFDVPHGLACAFTMQAVLRHNLQADDGRFGRMATALAGEGASLRALVDSFDALHAELHVGARVREMIGDPGALLPLASEMLTPGRADNNLADVDSSLVKSILSQAWTEQYE
jgi:phosphonate metabolism-associated iron-containing alcohol dehydrogenase